MDRATTSSVDKLFANGDPETTWRKAVDLIQLIHPAYNFTIARAVFEDVMNLFGGKYPGYCPIQTPYHDRSHTLDVFLCAVRLMHGMQLSGAKLSEREVTLVAIATLLHDVGYAQLRDGTETGTGAQYTPTHVRRGIDFMRSYIAARALPADFADDLAPIISCSDPRLHMSRIRFPDERVRLCGQLVGTADLVGQMADRNYLEKLVALYQEFEEAQMGGYKSVHDMMRKTKNFYAAIQKKLDEDFGKLYTTLPLHFKETLGSTRNYYMEAIQRNMDYLARLTSLNETEYLSMLRRGGIVEKFRSTHSE